MKVANINKVIDNLVKEPSVSAILIDGRWGIGKTYATLEYIKTISNIRYGYVSLFGKNTLDEINTELYNNLNPEAKGLETISHVVSLVGASISVGTSVGINLNGNTIGAKKKIRNKRNKITVVVVDDFERKNPDIKDNELLGYFNKLLLEGIKIIVLSNLDTHLETALGEYKEKIFDRIYSIRETRLELAQQLVGDEIELQDKHLELANQNLRMIIKAKSLFNQVKQYLRNKSVKLSDEGLLFSLCLYIVIETLTRSISKNYLESATNNDYLKLFYDENPQSARITAIESSYKQLFQPFFESESLINALFEVFEYENYTLLEALYIDNKTNKVFGENLYYLSDEQKIQKIKQQYEFILSNDDTTKAPLIWGAIKDWYNYCSFLNLSFINEKLLFEKMDMLGINESHGELCVKVEIKNFLNRYFIFQKENKKQKLKNELSNTLLTSKEGKQLLFNISNEYTTYEEDVKEMIKNILVSKKFFIINIHSQTTEEQWQLTHTICQLVSSRISELKDTLFHYLCEYKEMHPHDASLNHRLNALVEHYHLNSV